MQITGARQVTRAGRAAAAAAAAVVALTAPSARTALELTGSQDFPVVGLAVVQLAALAVACWVLVVVAAGAARLQVPGVPRSMRVLLFTTIAWAAVGTPAHADAVHDLDGLTLPDRPVAAQQQAVAAKSSAVTVRPGDTMWALAAEHLPARASNAQIATACAAWHRANRQVIGPDPDLILPGQVLLPPTHEQDAS